MWLDNLKELKKEKGMSSKQIAELTNLPERTVARIFSGDTEDPRVDTVRRIVTVLGGSLDDIFAESGAVIGNNSLIALQGTVSRLTEENELLTAENAMLNNKVVALTAENDLLRLKLEHKEEIIFLHNYYTKLKASD